jgi:hypothetical protein
MNTFSQADMARLFGLLNEELAKDKITGEIYLVGGAVMCLVYDVRHSTKDVDGFFKPTQKIREAAARVALKADLPADWLNDGAKGYFSQKGTYQDWLELSNLKVFTAQPDYLLAMKCLAMRIGAEFHDLDDVRYLLRYLNITSYHKACEVIGRFYPLKQFPQKTLYALEELLVN